MSRCGRLIGLAAEAIGTQRAAEGPIIEACSLMITKKLRESMSGQTLESRSTLLRLAQPVGIRRWKNNIPMMRIL